MNIFHGKIKDKITIKRATFGDKNKSITLRKSWHKNIEICRIITGRLTVVINNKCYCANKGDIVFINSGEIHFFESTNELCTVDICTFDPLILYNFETNFGTIKTHIKAKEIIENGLENQVSFCFSNLFSEKQKEDFSGKIIMQSEILKIYGLLIRNFKEEKKDEVHLAKLNSFYKIIEYISDNYDESITLEFLAKKFNYNPIYLSAAFSLCTGVGFKYYLDNVRVSKSIEFLTKTTLTISEIALNCGFSNIRTFNNVFKKITGTTPKNVRKS